jgi:hypothetical protein
MVRVEEELPLVGPPQATSTMTTMMTFIAKMGSASAYV